MTTGAGIALAGIWIATAFIIKDRDVTGLGLIACLFAAIIATSIVMGR